MLRAIAELAEHNIGYIEGILTNEVNADPFGANQSYHLFDLLLDSRSYVSKEQVRFVEKENQLWFFRITYFREILEQLGEHPQKKRRVNLGRLLHQSVRSKNIDHALAALRLDQVV